MFFSKMLYSAIRWILLVVILLNDEVISATRIEIPNVSINRQKKDTDLYSVTIPMPVVETSKPDQYMCSSASLKDLREAYILKSVITADKFLVHHVSTGLCEKPYFEGVWDCADTNGTSCNGSAVNFGIWDAYSVKTGIQTFTKDVSIKLGGSTKMHYIVTEVHFIKAAKHPTEPAANVTLTYTKEPTKYNYQTYMMFVDGFIPEKTDKGYFAEIACPWKKPPAWALSFYVHTHHHGYMAQLFIIRNRRWITLGSQFTQNREKTEYKVIGGPVEIKTGDILAARCFFINSGDNRIAFGTADGNEMCNIDINLGYEPRYERHFTRSPACMTMSPQFSFCDHEQTNDLCS